MRVRLAGRIARQVLMAMMIVMHMHVLVLQLLVAMFVLVPLGNMQPDA